MQVISPNKYTITIDGTDYTKYVPFPLKYSRLLDEQLDEGGLSLIRTTQEIFTPFTPVVITMWNASGLAPHGASELKSPQPELSIFIKYGYRTATLFMIKIPPKLSDLQQANARYLFRRIVTSKYCLSFFYRFAEQTLFVFSVLQSKHSLCFLPYCNNLTLFVFALQRGNNNRKYALFYFDKREYALGKIFRFFRRCGWLRN